MKPAIAKRLNALEAAALPVPTTVVRLVAPPLPGAPKSEVDVYNNMVSQLLAAGERIIELVPLQPLHGIDADQWRARRAQADDVAGPARRKHVADH